ncbi:abortive infection system antitoxin AbiGi family protein [Aquibacillus saliphilus]|uniref:abortive infection system antitoxin AbiGi family protein n=1 Tax=Aquibacillus saliphilus TaxID=1909422 RepID=UPI001CF06EC6|nr:abortive infection system antitoxin AbiGi family protein [Aquibacillus saliphilus]
MAKPGYYSNIYWHFTGGPVSKDGDIIWHNYRGLKEVRDHTKLRNPELAMDNLKNIIEKKVLKATTTEKVAEEVETEKFCCVCDIPLNDLTYHRGYYGDYAIGFNSKKVHENFHPVLYLDPYHAKINHQNIVIDPNSVVQSDNEDPLLWDLVGIKKENPLLNFLKLTNFASDYDGTFYGEREWRCLEDFFFNQEEVEAIIVPKEEIKQINRHLNKHGYNNVSIMSWELIENV